MQSSTTKSPTLPFSLLTTTWNVSNAPPPDLAHLLNHKTGDHSNQDEMNYDLVVVALQEVPTRMDRVEGAFKKAGGILKGGKQKGQRNSGYDIDIGEFLKGKQGGLGSAGVEKDKGRRRRMGRRGRGVERGREMGSGVRDGCRSEYFEEGQTASSRERRQRFQSMTSRDLDCYMRRKDSVLLPQFMAGSSVKNDSIAYDQDGANLYHAAPRNALLTPPVRTTRISPIHPTSSHRSYAPSSSLSSSPAPSPPSTRPPSPASFGPDLATQSHSSLSSPAFSSSSASLNEDTGAKWKNRIKEALGPSFYLVSGEKLGAMRLWVFARISLRPIISHIETMHVATGFADRGKNKGAVAVAFHVRDTGFCFVGAHFAAHEGRKYLRERFVDYQQIIRKLESELNTERDGADLPVYHRFDHTFLMGDLNFRIVPPHKTHHDRFAYCIEKIHMKDYQALVKYDELLHSIKCTKVFNGFQEAPITFPPSFKYTPGEKLPTAAFNQLRVPAYCDRILHHSFPSRQCLIKQLSYESLPEYLVSDHKPVRATFQIQIPFALPRMVMTNSSSLRVCLDFRLVRLRKGFGKTLKIASLLKGNASLSSSPYDALRNTVLSPSLNSNSTSSSCSEDEEDDAEEGVQTPSVYAFMGSDQRMHQSSCRPLEREGLVIGSSVSSSDASESDDEEFSFDQMSPSGIVKRDSISSQTGQKASSLAREVRMEVHSHAGVFLKQTKVYKATVPKRRDGAREKSGDSLPCIPLCPVGDINDLKDAHVVISFRKPDHRIGASGVLPLRDVLDKAGQDYRFEMTLTKYGQPVGMMECVVELVICRDAWADSQGRIVKKCDGRLKGGKIRGVKKHASRMAAKMNAKNKSRATAKSVEQPSPIVTVPS